MLGTVHGLGAPPLGREISLSGLMKPQRARERGDKAMINGVA